MNGKINENGEMLYRLEFNENEQRFHLDYSKVNEENTNGWKTISENVTDLEWRVFESFIHRKGKKRHTYSSLLKDLDEVKVFWSNLIEWNIIIKQSR